MDGHMNTLKAGNLARAKRFILRELGLADGSEKEPLSAVESEKEPPRSAEIAPAGVAQEDVAQEALAQEDSVQYWRERGGAFAAEGKVEETLHCRRKAVELEPANEQVRLELLRALVLAGRFEEAKSSDASLLQLWRILGGGFPAEGRPDLGLYCRRRAVELEPADPQVRLELVNDVVAAGVDEIHTLDAPADAEALCIIARVQIEAGKLELATECVRWAVQLDKDNQVARQDLVRLLIRTRHITEAIEFSEAIDATKIHKTYERRYYKDFTASEKCTLLEASLVTLASPEAIVELIRAVDYVLANKIGGAFVECGVFQGGNAVVLIRTLLNAGVTDRDVYLYDTFEGFPKPEAIDFEYLIGPALETWQKFKQAGDQSEDGSDWLRYPLEKVRERVLSLGYPAERIHFVKGLVENTIPQQCPESIALLRLDTDFYRSTKHELIHMYPRLQRGGILIIDDYGALHGARVATDEYLSEHGIAFFPARVDEHVRVGVKL
jgi:tetratricopeptide (TPR) repeat protein